MKSTSANLTILRWAVVWILWPLLIAFILEAAKTTYHSDPASWMYDMKAYMAGARAVVSGDDPYTATSEYGEKFIYPPFALLLFLPFSQFNWNIIALIFDTINVVALQAIIYLSLKQIGLKRLAIPTVAIMLPSLLLLPIDQTINLGQVNLILLSLVIMDLSLPDKSRFKGVLIGISAGIKLVPGLFLAYYLMRRYFRAAITLCATALGTVLLAFIIFPKASYDYWTHYIFDTTRVARVAAALDNESLRGMLARILHSETAAIIPWIVFGIVMLCIAFVVTWYAIKHGEDYMGITAIALTGLLIAPVSWHHTWVWIVPITIYTVNAAYRNKSKFLWGCATIPLVIVALRMDKWFIPDPYQTRPLYGIQLMMSNIVTFASILLVICLLFYLVFYKKQQEV